MGALWNWVARPSLKGSARASFSQSSSSAVEGFFLSPGASRISKKIRSASSIRRRLMPG
jgi:hypothetical protein